MSETLSRTAFKKQVDSLDSTHRIDPLGGSKTDNDTGRKEQKEERKFKREPNPEDQVHISQEALDALKKHDVAPKDATAEIATSEPQEHRHDKH